jgi:hypothetical protein
MNSYPGRSRAWQRVTGDLEESSGTGLWGEPGAAKRHYNQQNDRIGRSCSDRVEQPMNIHFCDLCNESVPQSDLDEGRAFLRKGRVICATCDTTMSGKPGEAPVAGPFGGSAGPETGGGAGPAGAVATAEASPQTAKVPPMSYGAPTAYQAPMRARGGGAGMGIGVIAILFTGAVAFWAYDRMETLSEDLRRRQRESGEEQRLAGMRLDQELRRQSDASRQDADALREELRDQRTWLDGKLGAAEQRAREIDGALTAFGSRVDEMKSSFDEVNRHDQELMKLQQRYTALSDEVRLLGVRIEELGTRPNVGVAAPGLALEEPVDAPPPWMGLVEQLASPNTSDRWQAVVALGETRDPAVSEYLLAALQDQDIFIRMVTARVLGDLGSPVCVSALIDALGDEESAVREAAYIALRTVTKRDLSFDPVSEDTSERNRRIKAWRDWWDKEKDRFEGA